jgi:hypothetical protein
VKTANYAELCSGIKDNPHYNALGGQTEQQTLKSVAEVFSALTIALPALPRIGTVVDLLANCWWLFAKAVKKE